MMVRRKESADGTIG